MINIDFNPSEYSLSIDGHAGQNEKGKDIVCAAVSILYFTLVDSLEKAGEIYESEIEYKYSDGNGTVKVVPKSEYESNVQMMFWVVLNGINLLAEEYPQFIKTNF